MPASLVLNGPPLRAWQTEAIQAWTAAGRRGIVAAATGTGKTWFALNAIATTDLARTRIVVVVPTKVLQAQWLRVLETRAGLDARFIGTLGGNQPSFQLHHQVVVAVLNSARERLPALVAYWRSRGDQVLLVVDECHAAGTASAKDSLFSVEHDMTLGLSATPERVDDGLDQVLVPNLGEVVFRYPLRQALDDGALAPLAAINIYVELSAMESHEYYRLQRKIELLSDSGTSDEKLLSRILSEQRSLLAQAGSRTLALERLVSGGLLEGRRTLIFHETIAQAEATAAMLRRHQVQHSMDHSKVARDDRVQAIRRFSLGVVDVLVTVRTVDEGVDVPDADTAVIVSGTTNARQRIQRLGRVIRPVGGTALAVSLLAAGTSEEVLVGDRDPELLGKGRVHQVRGIRSADLGTVMALIRQLA